MAKIIYKTKLLKKEDKKKVRDFIKDYDTKGLIIIFSERWDERVHSNKEYRWRPIGSCIGRFYSGLDNRYKIGACGICNIKYPLILVKIDDDWYNTFLHEFGHYLDDSLNGGIKKYKHKEEYANTFTNLMVKRCP